MLILLLLIPLVGIVFLNTTNISNPKQIGLFVSILNLFVSLIIFALFDYSNVEFQFIQDNYETRGLNIYLGVDGISVFFCFINYINYTFSNIS